MRVLTSETLLTCAHGGTVKLDPRQNWITIQDKPVLIEADTLNRPISGCPMRTPTTPPCTETVAVDEGPTYAAFITVQSNGERTRRRLCLDTATGRTNWSKLSVVPFSVSRASQDLVQVLA
jgi:hypothetical protein